MHPVYVWQQHEKHAPIGHEGGMINMDYNKNTGENINACN